MQTLNYPRAYQKFAFVWAGSDPNHILSTSSDSHQIWYIWWLYNLSRSNLSYLESTCMLVGLIMMSLSSPNNFETSIHIHKSEHVLLPLCNSIQCVYVPRTYGTNDSINPRDHFHPNVLPFSQWQSWLRIIFSAIIRLELKLTHRILYHWGA